MRIIVNENISGTVIDRLRAAGCDVLSVKEMMRGQPDRAVLGFGELAFRWNLPASCGVILLRLNGEDPERDNQRTIRAVFSRADWAGHFAVVTDDRIRIRRVPTAGPQRGDGHG
jgi:hypothetical protein